MDQTGFVQAGIRIEQERDYGLLQAAIERAFAPGAVEKFLKEVKRYGLRVRQFEAILAKRAVEAVDPVLATSGTTAEKLYQALTVSDQAQMREFYLTAVEGIAAPLRAKYHTQFETF